MSDKHTPGPWEVYGDVREGMFVAGSAPGSKILIADLNSINSENEEYVVQYEANARLIAAAPAMLDALDAVLDLSYDLIATAKRRVLTEADMVDIAPAFEAALAAAQKARGEEVKP